jgi:hypothetical protein
VASVVLRIDRAELVRMAALEAARTFMAAQLRFEREPAGDLEMFRDDALQSLRDCLAAERKVR